MTARCDTRYWDEVWGTVGGCLPVSRGCVECFGARLAATQQTAHGVALHTGVADWVQGRRWQYNGVLTSLPPEHERWDFPLRWPGALSPKLGIGRPSLIFVNVLSDTFTTGRPVWVIDRTVSTIAASPHVGAFVTKYAVEMAAYFADAPRPAHWRERCWLAFSAERQKEFDERWAVMRRLPDLGYLTFANLAPLLEPITLPDDFLRRASWVIVSRERVPGGRARPIDWDWARRLRDQCAGRVPFFLYAGCQMVPPDLAGPLVRQFPKATPATS